MADRRHSRYAQRVGIVKHFPSIDHSVLRETVVRVVADDDAMTIVDAVPASGAGVLEDALRSHPPARPR